MTEEKIRKELMLAAREGSEEKFNELRNKLESTKQNRLSIQVCEKILLENPRYKYKQSNEDMNR